MGHEGPVFIDKGCDDFITFTAGHRDKLFTNVRDTSSKPFVLMIMGNTMENRINVVTYLKSKSPEGTNVCGVKWYGGCLEVCQRPSNEEKLGAIFGDNRGIPK